MLTVPGEAHFWTIKDDIAIPETDFGAFRYHEKRDAVESLYLESKKSYAQGRGITWAVSNKKSSPVKKEALKELEDQLATQRVVRCEWRRHDLLQILLSSGLLINISVSGTGDIIKISYDKYLVGKLPSECLTDVVFGKSHVLLAFSESVISVVHLTKPHPFPEKLSRQEPKMATFDLGGPSGRRLERKISLSMEQNMVLVWWKCSQDEVYPWSPVVRECDRANLLVYSLTGSRLDLLCFYKTEADPVSVAFSTLQPSIIHLVEQKVSRKGEVSVESSRFELAGSRLVRASSVGALQLQTQTCCISRSPDESRLALGCIDGSVLLQSPTATLLAKAAFIPSLVTWHSDGTVVVAANEKGQIQCWDLALAPIRVQLLSEQPATSTLLDLTIYFRYQPTLCSMSWSKKAAVEELSEPYAPSDGFLIMYFERGPLTLLRLVGAGGVLGGQGGLTPDILVSQYLRLELADCAINLLASLSWNLQGENCLSCMHRVCNHLLAKRLSPAVEEQLEAALGTFMSPSVPLSLATEREFGRIVHHLGRRFFHHLLRYQRFDKSFRLAMDLGDRDLFMDIYHYARMLGDEALAQAARDKAEEVAEGSTTTASSSSSCQCSRSSCSECGTDSASPSSSDTEPEIASDMYGTKPTKVTFSDTVTHIVDISSGDEEEDEEEDDESEVQALIVSDTPLRTPPSSSHGIPHRSDIPKKSGPNTSSPINQSRRAHQESETTHPKYFMSQEVMYNSQTPISSNAQFYSSNVPPHSHKTSPQFSSKDMYSSVNKEYIPKSSNSSHRHNSMLESNTLDKIYHDDSVLPVRNSDIRSSVASIVSTTSQVQRANVTSLNSSKLSPSSRSKNITGSMSSNPSLYNAPLNLHIAKTSVTTLTDTATQASVTRVSESIESYRVPNLEVNSNPLHSRINSIPVSIQSSDIFITTGGNVINNSINQNSTDRNYTENTSNTFTGNDKIEVLNSALKISRNSRSTELLSDNNRDMSLYSFEVSPETLQKSMSLSSVASAFPLLNIHGHSSQLNSFKSPPLTVKPLGESNVDTSPNKNSHPLYLKPYSPQNRNQRENKTCFQNPPLLRLNNKDVKESPLLHLKNISTSQQNVASIHSLSSAGNPPKIPPKFKETREHPSESSSSRSNGVSKPFEYPKISAKPSVSFQSPPNSSRVEVSPPSHTVTKVEDAAAMSQPGSSQSPIHLPPNLSDKLIIRKYGPEVKPEEEETLANIKVVHFGVV